jgi:hypothetical protein
MFLQHKKHSLAGCENSPAHPLELPAVLATDAFVKIGGEWKQAASHGSEVK